MYTTSNPTTLTADAYAGAATSASISAPIRPDAVARSTASNRTLRRSPSADADFARRVDRLYDRFRAYARAVVRGRSSMHATTLLNGALIRLMESGVTVSDDERMLALVSLNLRREIIDRIRERGALKRGGDRQAIALDPARHGFALGRNTIDLLALDEAIERMRRDPALEGLWRVVELRFFSGLTTQEIAETLNMSLSSAEREWRFARAWLRRELCVEG